jgi:hypothetical protein
VPDTRSHRGPDPRDALAFAPGARPALRAAVSEFSWLLGRGYATASALKIVGDRRALTDRQRHAVFRSACPDDSLARRTCRRVEPEEMAGEPLAVDGFNVLTTVEAALGGAAVLVGRDGSLRDVAGVHGTYRKVEETAPALGLTAEVVRSLGVGECTWYLDRPVSNSGRLAALIRESAARLGLGWRVEVVFNPDAILAATSAVVASADGVVLDHCGRWLNLARLVVGDRVPGANVVDLTAGSGPA